MRLTLKGIFRGEQRPVRDNPTILTRETKRGDFEVYSIPVKIKLEEGGILPCKAHDTDAGYDLYLNTESPKTEDVVVIDGQKFVRIYPGTTVKVSSGFSASIPEGYVGHIWARSGLSTKQGLRPANCVGTCDSAYRGVYIVPLYNDSNSIQYVKHGERIAQLTIDPVLPVSLMEVNELDETDRGAEGFGDSGRF